MLENTLGSFLKKLDGKTLATPKSKKIKTI
jgi:hypothetical protein